MNLSEIAALVGGVREGETDPDITGVAPLDRAGTDELAFLAHPRYLSYVAASRAGALLVGKRFADRIDTDARPRVVVDDVHGAVAEVLQRLHPEPEPEPGVHPTAVVDASARLGQDVVVGPYAVIGRGARIGDRARVGAHTVIEEGGQIGEDAVLHPHVVLYRSVRVGARSILHSGVRAGVDGFGYVSGPDGHRKVPQVGDCVVGSDVEVGANTTIDRGSVGTTEIGDGVKIDNLTHIGHNVRVGENSIIVAQVGVAGSTTIGRRATLGGQAGVPGHIEIGDDATIAARAGVFGNVPAGAVYSGYPARPHKEALRAQASLFRLPTWIKRLRAIERAVFGKDDADE